MAYFCDKGVYAKHITRVSICATERDYACPHLPTGLEFCFIFITFYNGFMIHIFKDNGLTFFIVEHIYPHLFNIFFALISILNIKILELLGDTLNSHDNNFTWSIFLVAEYNEGTTIPNRS
ncbi:hypothetical protein ACJX0J_008851 [Zea mays]